MTAARRMSVAVGLLLAMAACRSVDEPTPTPPVTPAVTQGAGLPELRPLDDAHAGDFRRAFDDAKDHARFVVALSPT